MNKIVKSENIALLDLFYERWSLLKNSEPFWSQKICMLEALIERLEDTVPGDIDKIVFEHTTEQPLKKTHPAIAWPVTTPVTIEPRSDLCIFDFYLLFQSFAN